jgi:hypothetical protein
MRIAWPFVLVLGLGLSAQANPLEGTWKSDRKLTLERLAADSVPPQHRKVIIEEADLGNAIVEFSGNEYVWTLGDQTRRLPYRIVSVEGHHVEIEYFQRRDQTNPTRMRLFVTGNLLYTPIRELDFYEVFRRVPRPAAPSR